FNEIDHSLLYVILEECVERFDEETMAANDIDDIYDSFLSIVRKCMTRCVPQRIVRIGGRRPWSNPSIRRLSNKIRNLRRRSPHDDKSICELTAELESKIESVKLEYFDDIQHDFYTDPKKFWNYQQSLRSE